MPPRRTPVKAIAAPKTDAPIVIGELKILPDTIAAIDDIVSCTIDKYHREAFREQYLVAEEKKRPSLVDSGAKGMIIVAICLAIESTQKTIALHAPDAPPAEAIGEWIAATPDIGFPFAYVSASSRRVDIDGADADLEAIIGLVGPMFGDADDVTSAVSEAILRFIRIVAWHVSNTSHAAPRRLNADKMLAIIRNMDQITQPGAANPETYFKQIADIKLTLKKKASPRRKAV